MEPKLYILIPLLILFLGGSAWILRVRKKLRLLEKFRRDFIANISHEFRTPLSVIKGYTETLTSHPSLDQETSRSFLRAIEDHTERLIRMVEDLINLSRLENIQTAGASSLIHLPEYLENVRRRFHRRLDAQQIRWNIDITPPLENFESDASLLEMIFNNLIDNAVKYTDSPGMIRIHGERKGDLIRFCVEDTGIGISPEEQKRIFERFYRTNKDRGREPGGTGLGLSIVKHAVLSLGGKIWVESEVGKGSRFFFTIRGSP